MVSSLIPSLILIASMSDAISFNEAKEDIVGFKNKNSDVRKREIVNSDKIFKDVQGHINKDAIEALSKRGIVSGKNENEFKPDSTLTRAEFATIIVNGLGLSVKNENVFADVTINDWFYDYVNTAYCYEIIKGISENEFNPHGIVKREEAATMTARAAKLCGLNTDMETFEAKNILSEFSDYVKVSDWAVTSLAFCFDNDILSGDVMEISPEEAVTRGEMAGMLYNMLNKANLL